MNGLRSVEARGLLAALAVGLVIVSPVWAEDKPDGPLAALERKLHGVWIGSGPCDGRLLLKADKSYAREQHGPAGNNSAGTWIVRWDALPPTLVLSCQTSDDPLYSGKTVELKVHQLDDATLVTQYPGQPPARYTRSQTPAPGGRGQGDAVTKDELTGQWRSVQVTLSDGQRDLELKADGTFIYQHLDVSLGWRTTLVGAWELKTGRVVLTARQRRHDGKEVEVGEKKTDELTATRRGDGWILSGRGHSELRRAPPSK